MDGSSGYVGYCEQPTAKVLTLILLCKQRLESQPAPFFHLLEHKSFTTVEGTETVQARSIESTFPPSDTRIELPRLNLSTFETEPRNKARNRTSKWFAVDISYRRFFALLAHLQV